MAPGAFEVARLSIEGNPNVGVYLMATDEYALVPPGAPRKLVNLVREVLKVERVVEATVLGTRLIGVMTVGNESGLLLPGMAYEEEVEAIRRGLGDVNVGLLDSRSNALGNVIAANRHAALVHPGLERHALKAIEEVLGVEPVQAPISHIPTVGAVLVVTNRGGVVYPEAGDEEIRGLSRLFKVPIYPGTVNFGVSFVSAGLVANSHGALVGEETTGPEMARIQYALGGAV